MGRMLNSLLYVLYRSILRSALLGSPRMKVACFCLLAALGLGWASVAAAGLAIDQPQAESTPTQEAVASIPRTLETLKEAKTGKYGRLDRNDRRQLEAAEREIIALQSLNPKLDSLSADEQVRLFNAQESILTVVTGLKKSQLVCTYRQNIGTRFRTKHCMTRDMAEAQKRAARESMRSQEPMCVVGEGQDCMTGMQRLNRVGEFQPPAPGGG